MNQQSKLNLGISGPDMIADVIAFHRKFGIEIPSKPTLSRAAIEFRIKFIREELTELEDALNDGDLAEVADAFGDITYVAIGGSVQCGVPAGLVWDEIQRSNMDKVPASPEQSWKHCVKPDGWVPPKIAEVLALAGYEKEVA